MQTKEIIYSGRKLSYRTGGEGTLVVLLHGFGEEGSIWERQFGIFPHHQVLVPDLPGSGNSEALADMRMEGMAAAVKAIIDAEGGSKATICLIGHSMGGYITLAFAERYPDRLRSFGLFHSTAFADSEEKVETRRKGIRFIQEYGAQEFLKAATPNLYALSSRELHPGWMEEHLARLHNFSAASLVSYYTSMIQRPDRTSVLRESKVPVLFVLGRHDSAVPLQDGWKQCYLPSLSYIHILENTGHMGMIEESDRANQILSQFVNTTEKAA